MPAAHRPVLLGTGEEVGLDRRHLDPGAVLHGPWQPLSLVPMVMSGNDATSVKISASHAASYHENLTIEKRFSILATLS